MDSTEATKHEIVYVLSAIYGEKVGTFFESTHGTEVLPVFIHNSFTILKQNMGYWKASEQFDEILSKHGISFSSYD